MDCSGTSCQTELLPFIGINIIQFLLALKEKKGMKFLPNQQLAI
jgi:hypothetical protein